MKRRVVITGMGAVTPIGNTLDEFWNGIKEEKVGIGAITKFDTEDYKVKIAAEVKDFNVKERLDNKAARRMEVFSQYAVAASREAFAMAGLDMEKEDPYRVGVIIGSGIGGLSSMEKEHEKIITKGPKRVSPMLIPLMISNMAAGNVAIDLGCKGKCTDVVTACATGSNSIGDALRAIQYGDADVMLAGGTESSITPVAVAGFTNLTALSSESDPLRASLPFDEARGGFVIGEGAGVVVLEELEHAKKRGAKILAELAGYGSTCDAFHITSPAEDGSGAAKAMELAMEEAGVKPEEVEVVKENFNSKEWQPIGTSVPYLAGEYFLVTGSGKYFRNVILKPEDSICMIELDEKGENYRIVWGLVNGGRPTSELPSHLMNLEVKKKKNPNYRVAYHAHTTNIIALTFVLPLEDKVFTRELWEMATECPVVFPDGIGVVPWMVPGGREIAVATSKLMEKYDLAIWAHHGTFAAGEDFDLTFGLMHTAEKSAEILVKMLSMQSQKHQTIQPDEFRQLAKDFKVTLPEKFLYEK